MKFVRGGLVIDGTGAPAYEADIVVDDGAIADVGRELSPPAGAEVLDATGLTVAPGFIDIHSHSDFTLLVDPRAVSQITQGVTLEVVGNCGFGCSPLGDPRLVREAIYGFREDVALEWNDMAGYLARLELSSRKLPFTGMILVGPAAADEDSSLTLNERGGNGGHGFRKLKVEFEERSQNRF